jgi:hypothetical protein
MDKNRFENVIVEFAPKFENLKPLARGLRHVLFPIRDGTIFTGTFHDHDIMYDGMIMAFNTAIGRLGKEEQAIAYSRSDPKATKRSPFYIHNNFLTTTPSN